MFEYVEYLAAGFADGVDCPSFTTLEAAKAFLDTQGPGHYTILKLAGSAYVLDADDPTIITNPYLAAAIGYLVEGV